MIVEESGGEDDGEREKEVQVIETPTKSHLPSWVYFSCLNITYIIFTRAL